MARWRDILLSLPVRRPDPAANEIDFLCRAGQLTHLTSDRSRWRVVAITREFNELSLRYGQGAATPVPAVAVRRADTPS